MDQSPPTRSRRRGRRLRRIHEQQRLTLESVEVLSHGRFKRETLGSYERGNRALKVETGAERAWLYGVAALEAAGAVSSRLGQLRRARVATDRLVVIRRRRRWEMVPAGPIKKRGSQRGRSYCVQCSQPRRRP